METQRQAEIGDKLNWLKTKSVITSFRKYTHEKSHKVRWTIVWSQGSRSFNTSEVEIFLTGALVAIDALPNSLNKAKYDL